MQENTFRLCQTFKKDLKEILPKSDDIWIKKNSKLTYLNIPCCFDIEATSFYNSDIKQATMYAWVFGMNGRCIRGRTWREYLDNINRISTYYKLSSNKRIIIYIHNLSYEFQWFFKYFTWEKVFATDNRKPLYALTVNGIEYRCSYLLTGYSLEKLGENLVKYKVAKMVGDLDYDLVRHSSTPLTDKEWNYILHDALVVMAKIQEEIERLGGIHKIPLTKTGYVRELVKQNCLKGDDRWDYSRLIRSLTLTLPQYQQLKRAYTGGFTHANYHRVNRTIKNVYSYDFTSSYPAVMVSEKYPMSSPHYKDINSDEEFYEYLNAFCCMFDITFHNIRSKYPYENYISISRCWRRESFVLNNGRVIEAELLSTTLTEQDFFIIRHMYEWDSVEISNFHYFFKDYLPKPFIQTILELYKDKTELKGVEGKEVEYLNSKEQVNSAYGMCVTDTCKDEYTFGENGWHMEPINKEEAVEKNNKNPQRTLYYAWGVWVTAYARRNLFEGIFAFGSDYIYSDTDSVKSTNGDKHIDFINYYNEKVTNKIEKCLNHYNIPIYLSRPKTKTGIEKPLGVWEFEGVYDRFKTLGAKRYLTETNGNISITIAGVGKKAGTKYLKHIYNNNDDIFRNFTEDLYFPPHYECNGEDCNGSGKLCHTYIDEEMFGEIIDYLGNKQTYYEGSGVHMENTHYTLSLEAEYIKLITNIKEDCIAL